MTLDRTWRATRLRPVTLDDPLPPGVVGRLAGIALVYGVVDDHGTTFEPGCLARTVRERVAAGKVRLFLDHGDAPLTGMYSSGMHVGTVRSVTDIALEDGTTGAEIVADLFDTEAGRAAHQYVMAVQATGGEVGLSVGFERKGMKSTHRMVDGYKVEAFTEIPLREISVTAISSVPGTLVTAVRSTPLNYEPIARGLHAALGDDAFRALVTRILGNAEDHTDSDAGPAPDSDAAPLDSPQPVELVDPAPALVPYAERLLRYRALIQ